ncbi:hypothetical protein ADUPG1_009862 [Aduncisulcus paluster]|uniref:Uncharacterized protein n=1 Tax=Aduncisulcus paluster TaxID=2918883 RepID=A0ABQ5KX13_9EUKA|nr:hypothetical protein ADUPG1_009862 [Aduncisulcus paluster]
MISGVISKHTDIYPVDMMAEGQKYILSDTCFSSSTPDYEVQIIQCFHDSSEFYDSLVSSESSSIIHSSHEPPIHSHPLSPSFDSIDIAPIYECVKASSLSSSSQSVFLNTSYPTSSTKQFLQTVRAIFVFKTVEFISEHSKQGSESDEGSPKNEAQSFVVWYVWVFKNPQSSLKKLIEWSGESESNIKRKFAFWRKQGVPAFLHDFFVKHSKKVGLKKKDRDMLMYGKDRVKKGFF